MNMKKIFLGLLTLLAFSACGDLEEATINVPGATSPSESSGMSGHWYEETFNEEDSYAENGTFYSVFSNLITVGRIEGTYELNGNKLTQTFTNYGQPLATVFTISDKTDKSFTMSSSTGTFHYGKVVDVVEMEANGIGVSLTITSNISKSKHIKESATVGIPIATNASVVSLDESLVKIDTDGTLVGQGMKGCTYVRITDGEETYYVKVIVDVNQSFYDLWYGYPRLFGMDKNQMVDLMGSPAGTDADGTVTYMNMQGTHDYVDFVRFSFSNQKIDWMTVMLKAGTAVNTVHSYLSARYYYETTTQTANGTLYLYRSHYSQEQSEYLIGYYPSYDQIVYELLAGEEEYIPDYTQHLGMTRAELFASQDRAPFSDEGNIITYVLDDNNIAEYLFFTFDANNEKVMAVSLYLRDETQPQTVVDWMNSQYTVFEKGTADDGSAYAWINAATLQAATAGITYDVATKMISYVDLTASRSQANAKNFGWDVDAGMVRGLSVAKGRRAEANGETARQSLRSLR